MMTENHPITPPIELVKQWSDHWLPPTANDFDHEQFISIQAARWGADQELEACCSWLAEMTRVGNHEWPQNLRASRRPKPPSLKEQALSKLPEHPENMASHLKLTPGEVATIRRALESLPE